MEKIALALALTTGCVLAGYAEEQAANPFDKTNKVFVQGTRKTGLSWAKGIVEITEQDGKRVYKVISDDPKVLGRIYCNEKISAKTGDKVLVRIKASGKGEICPSLRCFSKQEEGQKEKFLIAAMARKPKALTAESQELQFEIVIPYKDEEIAYVRTTILLSSGTEVVLEQVEFKFAE